MTACGDIVLYFIRCRVMGLRWPRSFACARAPRSAGRGIVKARRTKSTIPRERVACFAPHSPFGLDFRPAATNYCPSSVDHSRGSFNTLRTRVEWPALCHMLDERVDSVFSRIIETRGVELAWDSAGTDCEPLINEGSPMLVKFNAFLVNGAVGRSLGVV